MNHQPIRVFEPFIQPDYRQRMTPKESMDLRELCAGAMLRDPDVFYVPDQKVSH